MSVCTYCNREVFGSDSCTPFPVRVNGVDRPRIPYGQERKEGDYELPDTCHDCGVKLGGYHHPGCDMEECPDCGHQIFFCDCEVDDEATRSVAEVIK